MPVYKKKKYAAKRKPKRSARRTPTTTIASLLQGAALGYLKRRLGLNTEQKYVDTSGTTTATATLVNRIASPTIAQGLTVNTRQGASIRVTRTDVRISITPVATGLSSCIRVICVRYTDDASPGAADILQTTTEMTSPLHNNFHEKGLQLLHDQVYPVGTTTSPGGTAIEFSCSRANDHMVWTNTDTTGVQANLVSGGITVWWMMDSNFTTAPIIASTMRTWFVDN